MGYQISPEPDEAERAAIVAALAADEAEQERLSPWVQAILPERSGERDEPYPQ
jgi:hypothetical protein